MTQAKSRPFKASMNGTCALCCLAIAKGERIVKVRPVRRYKSTRTYAHPRCVEAWQHTPDQRELVACPECGTQVEWRFLREHLAHMRQPECEAYRIGATPLLVDAAVRRFLYERLERVREAPINHSAS